MRYASLITATGSTNFPDFKGERVYMREFLKAEGLPSDLSRWQMTVDAMLDGVDTDQPIYIMIDEAFVPAGKAQRREGLHIDGYWNPGVYAHGNSVGSGHSSNPGHTPTSGSHSAVYRGHHSRPDIGRHGHQPVSRHSSGATRWQDADFSTPEGLILASSVSASRGFVGEFLGPIGEGGDCSRVSLSGLTVVPMKAGTIYAGNVTALHETLPVESDCYRQLVRLNVPGWTP